MFTRRYILVFAAVLWGVCFVKSYRIPDEEFIIGGHGTAIETRRYQVSIQIQDVFACSGALVKPNLVLTVASCVTGYPTSDILVRAGSSRRDKNGETKIVEDIVVHENFTEYANDYDIAILKLSEPFKTSSKINTIRIAKDPVQPGQKVYISGWGLDEFGKEGKFKKLMLRILSLDDCRYQYPFDVISQRMMCAWKNKYNAPCWDDFGDPLHNEWNALVGLYSWSRECDDSCTCHYPSIFTNVHPYRTWLAHKIQDF